MADAVRTTAGEAEATDERRLALTPSQVALALTCAALLWHVAQWGFASPWGAAPAAGALLVAAACGWAGWAWWCLRRAGNSGRVADPPAVFVDHGPYAWGRHPMALAIAAAMLGTGLATGAAAMLPATVAFVLIADRLLIPREEAALKRAFGAWYSDYASDVPRWF